MRLGFHAGAWGTDHLFQALNQIGATGLRTVEVYTDVATVYDGKADEFHFFLEKAGLDLVGAYGGGVFTDPDFREVDVEGARAVARWLKEAGGRYLILQGGDRSEDPGHDVQIAAATANAVGKAVRNEGVEFCFQPHTGTPVFRATEVDAFLSMSNPVMVGLCLDTGHLAEAGIDLLKFVQKNHKRIRVVHLRDLRRKPVFVGGPFANAGRGTVPLLDTVDALRGAGYMGPVVGFADDPREDPAVSAASFATFAREKLGLEAL